jgi:hypothetical protein
MLSQEDIEQQRERLHTHRYTLNYLLRQEAIHTTAHSPPSVAHGIREARTAIGQIKAILQAWGVDVEDHPDDTPPAPELPRAVPASGDTALAASLPSEARTLSSVISYSTHDEAFATRLHARMREAGLQVWFAPEDMCGGQKLHEQISQAITSHDKLLIILSAHSLRSEWVMTEIRKARRAELKEQRRKLFPIRLIDMDTLREWECFDADIGKDLAVEVREYFIPDFSHWRDAAAFERSFARLLRDLRAAETATRPDL